MDLEAALKVVETYARDYIRYLLSVFGRKAFVRRTKDLDPKLITFSLISVFAGNYLHSRYIEQKSIAGDDAIARVVSEFAFWIAISLFVHIGVNLGRKAPNGYTDSLSVTLRVLPVAYVLSSYAGFLTVTTARSWAPACAPWWAYVASLVLRAIVVAVFFPISITLSSDIGRVRKIAVTAMVLSVTILVQVWSLTAHFTDQANQTLASSEPVRSRAIAYIQDPNQIRACGPDQACRDAALVRGLVITDFQGVCGCVSFTRE